jgi:hypothetical protein
VLCPVSLTGSSSNLVTTETETTTVFPTTSSSFGASDTNTTSSTSPTFYTTPVERTLGQEPVLNSQLYPPNTCIPPFLVYRHRFFTEDSSSTAVFLFYCSHSQQHSSPNWALAMTVVGALCGLSGVITCSVCILKCYRRYRSQTRLRKDESAREEQGSTLPHQRREKWYAETPRRISCASYDSIRFYENICGDQEVPPCSTTAVDLTVGDSEIDVQMKSSSDARYASDCLSNYDYMEMKPSNDVSVDVVATEQEDTANFS